MDIKRRFRISLIAYVVIALLIWATLRGASIVVNGHLVNLQYAALVVVGLFALKTILHWKAEQIQDRKGR
jgi:ABC-type transport system involved in cytochrome bd biosynthesis fused ATPase/permease subunit